MSDATRQLAIVRRAAFGKLPSGEPTYDPPIEDAEIHEMREILRAANYLSSKQDDGDRRASPDFLGAAHHALILRRKHGYGGLGAEPQYVSPITYNEIEAMREKLRLFEAYIAVAEIIDEDIPF